MVTRISDQEWEKFSQEFRDESPRAAALLIAAMYDELLGRLLSQGIINDKTAKELLWGHNAPLGTFSARLMAAYGFGFISERDKRAINYVRKIRNEFAHNLHDVSFESSKIASWCEELGKCGGLQNKDLVELSPYGTFMVVNIFLVLHIRRMVEYNRLARPLSPSSDFIMKIHGESDTPFPWLSKYKKTSP